MARSLTTVVLSATVAAVLSACVNIIPVHESRSVPPGKVFPGPILNITAPNTEGWLLLESSPSGMVFARMGNEPGESFAAQVARFDAPQTDSPQEFEVQIVEGAKRDAETERFSTKQFTYKFSSARGYPCVQMHNISEDRQAYTGQSQTGILILQNEHLYCRHPVNKSIGFAITYSHRGKSLYSDFQKEAASFIEGVQVPK